MQGDPRVAQFYEKELVDKELWPLGEDLRGRFEKTKKLLLEVQNHEDLLGGEESKLLRQKLALRGPYVTPLNVLQAISRNMTTPYFSTLLLPQLLKISYQANALFTIQGHSDSSNKGGSANEFLLVLLLSLRGGQRKERQDTSKM